MRPGGKNEGNGGRAKIPAREVSPSSGGPAGQDHDVPPGRRGESPVPKAVPPPDHHVLAYWVRRRWPPEVLAVLVSALFMAWLHVHAPWLSRLNDWLLNDQVWGLLPSPAIGSPAAGHPGPPENLVVVDIGDWPDASDSRPQAQEKRDAVFDKILEILRLTAAPDPSDRPSAIGLDMTLQSLPSPPLREAFLCELLRRPEIFVGVEVGDSGILFPDNAFWRRLRNTGGLAGHVAVLNLEVIDGEPVRRYQFTWPTPQLGEIPSFAGTLAPRLDLPGIPPPAPGPAERRIRYRWYQVPANADPVAMQTGWDSAGGIPVLSLDAVLNELRDSDGSGLGPTRTAGSVLVFGVAGRASFAPDRYPICAYGAQPDQAGLLDVPQPGILIHLNAAASLRADPPEKTLPSWGPFALVAFLTSVLALLRLGIRAGLDRLHGLGDALAVLLYALCLAGLGAAAWWAGEWAARNVRLDVPLATVYTGLLVFVAAHPATDWFWRQVVLRIVVQFRLRRLPGFLRQAAERSVTATEPQRRFNAFLDLFQSLAALLAIRQVAAWFHGGPDSGKKAERKRRALGNWLVRPTIGKHRAILRDLAGPKCDLLDRVDPSGECDRAFDRLLEARNRFRHQNSAALSAAEWRRAGDACIGDLFLLLGRTRPLLGGPFLRGQTPETAGHLVSPGPDGPVALFPLIREIECDLHGRYEVFLYADGLTGEGPVRLEGATPGCTPRIGERELLASFDPFRMHLAETKPQPTGPLAQAASPDPPGAARQPFTISDAASSVSGPTAHRANSGESALADEAAENSSPRSMP